MTLYPIEAGNFKLDGGAMFGVVPKPLWEKTNPADNNNKIKMATRCLLIEDGKSLILVDTGFGNKQSEKFFSYYDLWGNYSIDNSLKKYGFNKNDITDVFFTHLHFDHCGGAIERKKDGTLSPKFKNAVFWVHEDHWNWAKDSNVREKASFIPENINPIKESGQLKFIQGKEPIIKNDNFSFDILTFDGHTEKQMLPLLNYKNKTLVFAGDLIPTAGHIPVPYIMGYDTRPLKTLEEKSLFLEKAVKNDYLLFMEHDANNELISLKKTEKGVRFKESFKFDSYF